MESDRIFGTMAPGRLFLRCAIPSMISMAVTSLYLVADGIFVGRYLGSGALAAVNLVSPFIMVSFALSDMVAVGSSVQISIRLGAGEREEASRIFSFCSALIVAISCMVGMAAFFLAEPLARLMGADQEVTRLAVEYMQVYAVFAPAIMIFFAVDNYLRICGKVNYSMGMNVAISLLNIFLDWLFVARLGWGVASAALASCLSLAAGTISGYLPFLRGGLTLKLVRGRIPLRLVGDIIANGSSEFFSNISASVYMAIINEVLLRLGGAMAVAAFSIVMYVDSIVKSMIFGMADSIQPAISYNYGAGALKRMWALEKLLLLAGAALAGAVMAVMLLGGHLVIPWFIKGEDPTLLEMSVRAMRLFSLSYLVCWFGIISSSFFTALGQAGRSLAVSFSNTLFFPVLCLLVLPGLLGLDGVWLTAAAASAMAALLAGGLLAAVLRGLPPAEDSAA